MDVELYVYDLSRGMARQMSMAFLGTQIDAVYHTSLVFGNVEYFFGQGVQTCYPGSTHHGQPMQRVKLGRTELDAETIAEYLESLKLTYTAESYDLFMHNCNNFSNDFSTFLVGNGIPAHITNLPQTVLNTPFGQMLKPQLDQAMRGITQAPIPASNIPPQTLNNRAPTQSNKTPQPEGKVHNVTSLDDLERILHGAKSSCVVIFFTSSTCAPCKILYKPFDELATEYKGKLTLIKIDVDFAAEIAQKYQIRATPTFTTFALGQQSQQWSGADPARLSANIKLLAQEAHPAQSHGKLELRHLQHKYDQPVLYKSVPPLEKMLAKLEGTGQSMEVQALKAFIEVGQQRPADASLPDLKGISMFVRSQIKQGQTTNIFALIDLLRVSMADPRVSGFLVEESNSESVILEIISSVCDWGDAASAPTKLVSVQLACNTFSTPLANRRLVSDAEFREPFLRMCTWLLLDESRRETRLGAANLTLNMLSPMHSAKSNGSPSETELPGDAQVEIGACLLEAAQRESDTNALRRLVVALGMLAYGSPRDSELRELLSSMGAADIVRTRSLFEVSDKQLVEDIAEVLA